MASKVSCPHPWGCGSDNITPQEKTHQVLVRRQEGSLSCGPVLRAHGPPRQRSLQTRGVCRVRSGKALAAVRQSAHVVRGVAPVAASKAPRSVCWVAVSKPFMCVYVI